MRIILFANNWVGWQVANYLTQQKDEIVALCLHDTKKQRYVKEIVRDSRVSPQDIYVHEELNENKVLVGLKKLNPELGVSAFWGYILKPEVIDIPTLGCINFHPGYLPQNRGMNPNVWPFIDGSNGGVSLHYINRGVDTGDIIARKKIKILPWDTAETLYNKTLNQIVTLFKNEWPKIKQQTNKRIPQSRFPEVPTLHKAVDVNSLDEINLSKTYTGKQIINILRSRSYTDRYYNYYIESGRKMYIKILCSPRSGAKRMRKRKLT